MERDVIQELVRLNDDFYRDNGASFSESRQSAWPGWQRVLACLPADAERLSVLDVACGNLRFERFMRARLPGLQLTFTCVDAHPELATREEGVRLVGCDVLGELLAGSGLGDVGEGHDLAVSFGFMHHVPTRELRVALLQSLISRVKPGGIVALSFWQFMDDPKLAGAARRVTTEFLAKRPLPLEEGDYLLGWNGRDGAYRYCHHFTAAEITALVEGTADTCELVDRFEADGRNGKLNGYAVLRRM